MSLNVTQTALDVTGFCKIYYNQQEKNEGPRLERHRSFFDAGDDTNAKKTADTVQISGMPKAGAVWEKIL
jgi:hypothetical protein